MDFRAVEDLNVAFCSFDEKGVLLACNLAWARLFALQDKEEAFKWFREEFKKSHNRFVKGIREALDNGSANLMLECDNATGEKFFAEVRFNREKDIVICHAFEITKYVRPKGENFHDDIGAEGMLKNAGENFHDDIGAEGMLKKVTKVLMDAAPFAVSVWDINHKFIDCNKQTLEMFGLTHIQEYGIRYNETIPEKQPCGTPSWERGQEYLRKTFTDGVKRFHFMRKHVTTGEPIPVEITMVRIDSRTEPYVAAFIEDLRVRALLERENAVARRWKGVLDTMPVGVNMYDENNVMLEVNKTMLEQFECTSKEEYLERWRDTLPEYQPDGKLTTEKFAEAIKEAFEKGEVNGREWQMQTINGRPVPMHIKSVVAEENGKPLLVTYTTDLRQLHNAMQKVQEEQEFNSVLYENSPYGVSVWNSRNEVIGLNRQLMKIFAVRDFEQFTKKFKTLYNEYQPNGIHSEEGFYDYMRRAFDGETVRFEWTNLSATGEELPLEITFVRYRRGDEYFVAAYTVDLRDVKSTMVRLREADERSAILTNATPIACALINSEMKVVECNQAAVNLLAKTADSPFEYHDSEDGEFYYCEGKCTECGFYRRAECVARRCLIRNWRHTIDGYRESPEKINDLIKQMCESAAEEGIKRTTSKRRTLSGYEIFAETTLVPVKYRNGQGYALYMQDLSEAKLREIAEEESRAKTRFLARMSHEIRTPMNAVLGVTEIQLQKGSHTPDTEDAFLRIHRSSTLLLAIINDILDLSKVEAGKMEIVPAVYEFASLVVDTVQLHLMDIGTKQLDFKLFVDENIPKFMVGDEIRIKQVLNNLLSNALKYTKEGEVTFGVSSEKTDSGVMLVCKVTDTGQGMTKSQLSTLFEVEFNRLNVHQNRDIQGSGLGLTITYHLVGLMNGKIEAESTPGKGSTFTVKIPQEIQGDEVMGKQKAAELQDLESVKNSLKKISRFEREIMSDGRVLIVDDVESNLFVAKGMLMPYKLTIETVTSGYEAVDCIKNGKNYDIIFMDHMMPGLDGVETTKIIRETGCKTPIVALTANIIVGQEEMFLKNGFSDFISKPIDANKLDECLKKFIKTSRQSQPKEENAVISDALKASFLRDAKKAIAALSGISNFSDKNLKLYKINAHGMKSALANIGENALSGVAGKLEDACNAKNIEKIISENASFLAALSDIVKKFSPHELSASVDENPEFLRSQLSAIINACENFDKKAAKNAVKALNQKSWSLETQKIIESISQSILHSDFDEAAKTARGKIT
ncbi:MAG: ATP-binding protein [Defluviitaleaceae bacterium]|nr:ATP-binding protein [Defluviitaleaceae bacterium]